MIRVVQAGKVFSKRGTSVTALEETSLTISRREYVAVIGPSGSGKSTLLTLIGGMLAPTAGKVYLDDQSLYDLSVTARTKLRGKTIGFVFQTFNLVSYLTAAENVQVPMYLAGVSPREQRKRSEQLLERVGLGDRMSHKPSELSVGQQQRVAIARTLANDPAVILADEPTGNLDPETREQVLGLFDSFHSEGRTVVVVTHDPVAAAHAHRTLRLDQGRVQSDQPLNAGLSIVA
jgi:putative ABC transport system ATP-binding protein